MEMMATSRALILIVTRVVLVALATLGVWLVVRALGGSSAFPPTPGLGILGMLPVNLITLYMLIRFLHAENQRLRDFFRPGRGGVLADVGWGLLWIIPLYLAFSIAMLLTVWALHGENAFTAMNTIFIDPDATPLLSPTWTLIAGILSVVAFVPINAPIEEAIYRGYAQSHLTKVWSAPVAILAISLIFGLQHIFFAATTDGMLVYFAAFSVWGLVSAIIVRFQKRLLPVTIAHLMVNLIMTVGPLGA